MCEMCIFKTKNVKIKQITMYMWTLMLLMEEKEICGDKQLKVIIIVWRRERKETTMMNKRSCARHIQRFFFFKFWRLPFSIPVQGSSSLSTILLGRKQQHKIWLRFKGADSSEGLLCPLQATLVWHELTANIISWQTSPPVGELPRPTLRPLETWIFSEAFPSVSLTWLEDKLGTDSKVCETVNVQWLFCNSVALNKGRFCLNIVSGPLTALGGTGGALGACRDVSTSEE